MAAFCRSTFTVFAAKKVAEVGKVKTNDNKKFANISAAVSAGAIQGCAPFPDGIDVFGFYNEIDEKEAQRYADVEITHGRVAMLASLGFLVGEQVEGSGFLFDANVTGPAINHFQQVPATFWGLLGALIFTVEANRVQKAWQNPFQADKLFLLKDDFTPGDYQFDPLKLSAGKDVEWLNDKKLKELNNGRVAMVAISGMIAQELVNGLNLIPADEVLEMGKADALVAMGAQCAGTVDEAACAKAFEAAERVATFSS
uniref:Chlorophyll a-b binding protein, chloroplastic n=1 Tax=Mantoniella antarctica TaxID=81844 RepID=A0A7S0XC12_9CHLO